VGEASLSGDPSFPGDSRCSGVEVGVENVVVVLEDRML